MILHGYWRSSASYRARIILNLKDVAYDYRPVHLLKDGGQQNASEYFSLNPLRQVPTLELRGPEGPLYLTQTVAIAEYLEEAHPEPALLPRGAWARAQARELVEMINSGMQPLQNLRVLRSLKALGTDARVWAREVNVRGLAAVEARLNRCAGEHAVGDEIGLVEAFLVPQLYGARRFEVDLTPYPAVLRVEAGCLAHPAFHKAHPDQQPDAPPPEERTP